MDHVSAHTAQVWLRGAVGPRQHLVMQVYDRMFLDVAPAVEVETRQDIIEIANRYGVPLDRVTFLGEAAGLLRDDAGRSASS
ncbi:hypothetical protein [Streptacidiphilus cavernicola]|uniref:Uncharacterized protein n=1 Tax=Streptacidiphilus cavernicola TaxID=3342716 RepID=A0ABV6VVU4_9ACTN